ncbi:MAG: TolB-like 6-bladed beta-propeller domain-containing protein [Tannerellaceae bacterium]|nr:TolB-like 6-bladed beta-propeller domain-containing protein [Tannerellaceae bacterium]
MKNICSVIILFAFFACKQPEKKVTSLFPVEVSLQEIPYSIDENELARIEGIQCNDSCLLVFDYHSGESFSLFNIVTGECIGRFGTIGDGPGELLPGYTGSLIQDKFYIYHAAIQSILKYENITPSFNIKSSPETLLKYDFPLFSEVYFSKLIPLNDSVVFAGGFYSPGYQYMLFDNQNEMIDYNVDVYNLSDSFPTVYHKMLANQGEGRKHPFEDKYAYITKYSSNIDFIDIKDNRINPVKLIRERSPKFVPWQDGTRVAMHPAMDCPIGYIDIAVSSKYVYGLHTEKDITNPYCSDIILVYDWEGNRIRKCKLNKEAYFITINERLNKLYAAVREEDGGWHITSYEI